MYLRRALVMNVFRKLIQDLEYLGVALHLDVDDVELFGVVQVLTEVSHFINDDLFVAVERFHNRVVVLIHNMHVHVLLQIFSSLRCRTHRNILALCVSLSFLVSRCIVPTTQELLVLLLSLKGKFMFTFILFGVL